MITIRTRYAEAARKGLFPCYAAEVLLPGDQWREVARYTAPWIDTPRGIKPAVGAARLRFLPLADSAIPVQWRPLIAAALQSEKTATIQITTEGEC